MKNKDLDWTIWVKQFEECVMRAKNPHSDGNHYFYCGQWLPSVLDTDAYTIWERCQSHGDWAQLKKDLEAAFTDPQEKANWKTDLQAYMWKEDSESLQTFCTNVKRKVDKYETELAGHTAGLRAQYYLRFVSGLPDDYKQQVKLAISANKADIDRGMEICTRFKRVKADFTPINKDDRRLIPAPRIPRINCIYPSSSEEDKPAGPSFSPISSRTRQGKAAKRAAKPPPVNHVAETHSTTSSHQRVHFQTSVPTSCGIFANLMFSSKRA